MRLVMPSMRAPGSAAGGARHRAGKAAAAATEAEIARAPAPTRSTQAAASAVVLQAAEAAGSRGSRARVRGARVAASADVCDEELCREPPANPGRPRAFIPQVSFASARSDQQISAPCAVRGTHRGGAAFREPAYAPPPLRPRRARLLRRRQSATRSATMGWRGSWQNRYRS